MKKFILFFLILLLIFSCKKNSEESSPKVSYYVSDVSSTAPILMDGIVGGERVNYVLSSEPIISIVENKKGEEFQKLDLRKEFSSKYNSSGFPQAALFVREDVPKEEVLSFLSFIDSSLFDLENGGKNTISFIKNNFTDDEFFSTFGLSSLLLDRSDITKRMGFVSKENEPSVDELTRLGNVLDYSVDLNAISPLYNEDNSMTKNETFSLSVAVPKGAPSLIFASYPLSYVDILSPDAIKAEFQKGEKDFVIFDAISGMKLSSLGGYKYKLVRIITFGNLFLINLGDDNNTLDGNDTILSFGEGLIPDKVFKAIYSYNEEEK